MAARKPPKNGRPYVPEKVRERIRLGMLIYRMQAQALGELDNKWEVCRRPVVKDGKVLLDEAGKPAIEFYRRSKAMTSLQFAAAQALVNKCLPNAEAPKDINLSGSVTVIDRDPSDRPKGYQRRSARPAAPSD